MKQTPQTVQITLAPKLKHVFDGPARYRVAYGGRGSSKSWGFADMLLVSMLKHPGKPFLLARELQNSIKDSVHKLLSDRAYALGLNWLFDIGESFFRCKNGSYGIFKGLRTNANEIKSLEGVIIAWVEEAQKVSQQSLDLLIPTIRAPGSELWFTYNPDEDDDAVYLMFNVNTPPPNTRIAEINFMDNPWFPQELENERIHFLQTRPDDYDHIWLGKTKRFAGGSIYGKQMDKMRNSEPKRITSVPWNPAFPVFTVWDLGYSDTMSIGFYQIVGKEPRCIDYYENNLEALDHYVKVIDSKDYRYSAHVLPHDAGHNSLRTGTTIKQQVETLGLKKVEVLPPDSIESGIELVRQLLQQLWIDETRCAQLIKALFGYQYEYDEERGVYKNRPRHDWASHCADQVRYAATYIARLHATKPAYEVPTNAYSAYNSSPAGWMG